MYSIEYEMKKSLQHSVFSFLFVHLNDAALDTEKSHADSRYCSRDNPPVSSPDPTSLRIYFFHKQQHMHIKSVYVTRIFLQRMY